MSNPFFVAAGGGNKQPHRKQPRQVQPGGDPFSSLTTLIPEQKKKLARQRSVVEKPQKPRRPLGITPTPAGNPAGSVAHVSTYLRGTALGDLGHDITAVLRTTTGVDLRRLAHPVRAYQQDIAAGKAGKRSEAIIPLGPLGRVKALGKAEQAVTKIPRLPEIPEAGSAVESGMAEATRLRNQQQALRSRELGIRASEYQRRLEAGGYTDEAYRHANAALKGAMPTLRWDRYTEMTPEAVDALRYHIETHPSLQGPDKILTKKNTVDALNRIVSGQLPRKFEQRLLRNVFGNQVAGELIASHSFWRRAVDVIGIPRTLMASLDLSAPLRQGLTLMTSHPVMGARNFPAMIRSFGSPATYEQIQRGIAASPNAQLYRRGDVAFTDLGHVLGKREEQFASSYAEKITGGRFSFVRASNRSFTAFLNKSRADYFDWLLERVKTHMPELDLETPEGDKVLKELGQIVNRATGRGSFKNPTVTSALPLINNIFFAPRLFKSRLDVLASPVTAWKMNPVARQEALKQLVALATTATGVLAIAGLAGARVSRDPTNADWGKIRVGNTRFDIAGGFLQPLRLVAQVKQGKITSSTTGKELRLGPGGGYGSLSRWDVITRFAETKLAPPPSFVIDFFRGSDFAGKPFSWKQAAYQRLVPLLVQDAADLYRQGDNDAANLAKATALFGIGMWGVGAQTYGPKKPKPKSPTYPRNPLLAGGRRNQFYGSDLNTSNNPFFASP